MCRMALADNVVLGRKPIDELAAIRPPNGCVDQSPRHRRHGIGLHLFGRYANKLEVLHGVTLMVEI